MAESEKIPDKDALIRDKANVMREGRMNALFFSLKDTFNFLGGLLMTVGTAAFLPVFINNISLNPGAIGQALSTAATDAVGMTGLGMIGTAALFIGASITSHFLSSRYYHSTTYDTMETNARHTAKYLVKEIKKENACIQTNDAPGRSDGKTWTQVVEARKQGTHPGVQV